MSLFGIRALSNGLMTFRMARTVLASSKHSAVWPRMIASVTWPIRAPWTNEDRPDVESKLATKRVS